MSAPTIARRLLRVQTSPDEGDTMAQALYALRTSLGDVYDGVPPEGTPARRAYDQAVTIGTALEAGLEAAAPGVGLTFDVVDDEADTMEQALDLLKEQIVEEHGGTVPTEGPPAEAYEHCLTIGAALKAGLSKAAWLPYRPPVGPGKRKRRRR